MRGAARRKVDNRDAFEWRQLLPSDRRGLAAVEGDHAEVGQIGDQRREVVRLGFADLAVAAHVPFGAADHVPQPDLGLAQRGQPVGIGQVRERLANDRAEQAPELVRRMRIILLLGERADAGQAPENQQSRIGRDVRRKAGVADGGHGSR